MRDRGTAYFVRSPRVLDDLRRPHLLDEEQAFVIEKRITLGVIDFENFVTDMAVERPFLEDSAGSCAGEDDGALHCLLVRERGKTGGVLVVPEAGGYVLLAAYVEKLMSET